MINHEDLEYKCFNSYIFSCIYQAWLVQIFKMIFVHSFQRIHFKSIYTFIIFSQVCHNKAPLTISANLVSKVHQSNIIVNELIPLINLLRGEKANTRTLTEQISGEKRFAKISTKNLSFVYYIYFLQCLFIVDDYWLAMNSSYSF